MATAEKHSSSPATRLMNGQQRQMLFERFRAANPMPATELEYSTPFELLAAVLLSAQATDVSVNKATRHLFLVASTPLSMLRLGESVLAQHIQSIGLYRTKARHLMEACRILVERHQGKVPRERSELEALPGVGRKTANVVLNVVFGEPTIAVDTHIFRVSNRMGLAVGTTPERVEQALLEVVPEAFRQDCHHWLILHGRHICKSRKPECWRCAMSDLCNFAPKSRAP